ILEDATIISCATTAVPMLLAFFGAHGIEYRLIFTRVAPHSPLIDEWKSALLSPLIDPIEKCAPVAYYSAAASARDQGTAYFDRLWLSIREPAMIGRMLKNLIAHGCTIFLEMTGQPLQATRIHEHATRAGSQVVTLPKPRSHPTPQMVVINGKPIMQLSLSEPLPYASIMNQMHDTLLQLGAITRPQLEKGFLL